MVRLFQRLALHCGYGSSHQTDVTLAWAEAFASAKRSLNKSICEDSEDSDLDPHMMLTFVRSSAMEVDNLEMPDKVFNSVSRGMVILGTWIEDFPNEPSKEKPVIVCQAIRFVDDKKFTPFVSTDYGYKRPAFPKFDDEEALMRVSRRS